jgi:DNA-binding transcriptional LysR family regulator
LEARFVSNAAFVFLDWSQRMELRHLRYFCAVADWNGFNRAARALHTSQSSISAQIRDLEQEIGVKLLNRTQSQVTLTVAGKRFLEESRKVVAAADRAVNIAQRTARGEIGSLTIGFLIWGTEAFFPGVIRDFRKLHPDVQLSLMEMLSRAQPEALLNGSIDIGFTRPLEPPYDAQLRSELLYTDPVVAVLPADHRLAGGPLRLHDLANERFVVCDRNIAPAFFDKFTSLCAQAGFSPNIVQTSNLVSSVLTLVEAGEGVTLLPSGLKHNRSDISFCPLIDPGGGIDLVMAWSPKREGETHKSFLDFMRSKKKFIRSSLKIG